MAVSSDPENYGKITVRVLPTDTQTQGPKQAQIGVPSVNAAGATTIGRISRTVWDQHYKILSSGNKVEPTEFASGSFFLYLISPFTFSKSAKLNVKVSSFI